MSQIPRDLYYTDEHEWARIDGRKARIGITAHATEQLGDVVFVDLPKVGARLERGKPFGAVESLKAVSELFAPLSGVVTAINGALGDEPQAVNADPYGKGWMIEVELGEAAEAAQLLSSDAYEQLIRSQA